MDQILKFQNYPTSSGQYYAANLNEFSNRIEVCRVNVVDKEVWVDGDEQPFIMADFDYWSDQVE